MTTSYVHDVFGNLAAAYTSNAPVDQPCTTCCLSWDHLGSTRLVTDSGGVVVARHDFLPFGQEIPGGFGGRNDFWGQTDQVTAKFTGQEHDTETALDFFQARYHANQQGRFMSVDPGQAGADPGSPQSWNGYGYVGNNPINVIDPSGMSWFSNLLNFLAGGSSGGPTACLGFGDDCDGESPGTGAPETGSEGGGGAGFTFFPFIGGGGGGSISFSPVPSSTNAGEVLVSLRYRQSPGRLRACLYRPTI